MKPKPYPISEHELSHRPVSKHSNWLDPKWVFDNTTAGQRLVTSTIKWSIHLPDKSRLTDPKWAPLLGAFRHLVWSLFTAPQNSKRYKPGMASEFERQISYFVCWMVDNGYQSFSELDALAFAEYVEHVRHDKCMDPERPPKARRLLRYLSLPTLIWEQLPELMSAGVDPPKSPPYGGSSAFAVANELADDVQGQIPPIEDDVFIQVMNSAILVLDDVDEIVGWIEEYSAKQSNVSTLNEYRRAALGREYLEEVSRKYPRALRYLRKSGSALVLDAIAAAREACSILIQGGVGLRTPEYCGLVVHPIRSGYPACVSVRKSISGLDEIFFIRGRVYKGEEGWADHEWVAGIRPVGDKYVPIPIQAILAMVKLFRTFRTPENMDRLALYSIASRWYHDLDEQLVPVTTDLVRRSQKAFVERHAGITEWNVTPSQWRKTFAQFVVRTDSRMVPALREHFHHLNLAITESGYAKADPAYKQVLDDAAVQNSIAFLGSLISGKRVADGTMAETVRESAARLRARLGNRSEQDVRNDIEEIVSETEIRVHQLHFGDTPAGDCVYRPGTGVCTKGCVARWVMPTPLWSAARPDVCWDCENIVVSSEHEDFWLARWERHDRAQKAAVASGDASLAYLARTRMAQCAAILSRLGVAVEMD